MNGAISGVASSRGKWKKAAVEAVERTTWRLAESWIRVGEAADESRTLVVARSVDGGAYGCRYLCWRRRYAAIASPSNMLRGKPQIWSPVRMMAALTGVVFPLEGIVLGDGFGWRDSWFVGLCGNGELHENSPHAMSAG